MKSRFLPYKDDDSILNYYTFPLIGISKKTFGKNFSCVKVNKFGYEVFIKVKEDIYPKTLYFNRVIYNDDLYLKYIISRQYQLDMQLIIQGRYSELSIRVKNLITARSALFFNKNAKEGKIYTSMLIFALHKDEILITYLYEQLKSNIYKFDQQLYKLLNEVELLEKPDETDFISI